MYFNRTEESPSLADPRGQGPKRSLLRPARDVTKSKFYPTKTSIYNNTYNNIHAYIGIYMPRDSDHISECLYRVSEFRRWVNGNHLFPTVSDAVVHPLVERLLEVEHVLIAVLYDRGQIGLVTAMDKVV